MERVGELLLQIPSPSPLWQVKAIPIVLLLHPCIQSPFLTLPNSPQVKPSFQAVFYGAGSPFLLTPPPTPCHCAATPAPFEAFPRDPDPCFLPAGPHLTKEAASGSTSAKASRNTMAFFLLQFWITSLAR